MQAAMSGVRMHRTTRTRILAGPQPSSTTEVYTNLSKKSSPAHTLCRIELNRTRSRAPRRTVCAPHPGDTGRGFRNPKDFPEPRGLVTPYPARVWVRTR